MDVPGPSDRTGGHQPRRGGAEAPLTDFRLPPGFTIELVAGPPLVDSPMYACFDDRGRLYVADSLGINLTTRADLAQLPNVPRVLEYAKAPKMQIRLLEDIQGDGKFDTTTTFADRITYPRGVLWHAGSVYTCAPPDLLRFGTGNTDGTSASRDQLVTGFTLDGAANDLSGPSIGPDGRIYWGCGHWDHILPLPGGKLIHGIGPRIYRCRPDGSELEMVSTAMYNPTQVAFTTCGEALACGTFLTRYEHPFRDGIIHCVEGGNFPSMYHDAKEKYRTGDKLPAVVHLGHNAPGGMIRYRSDTLGPECRDCIFLASYNLHSVQRHTLKRDGGSFISTYEDFVVSTDPNFHPTAVIEDADGSLLVIDTGTWFDICPTAGLGKTPVKGGIYRIRRAAAAPVADPWGLELAWDKLVPTELAAFLDDPRWAVRDRATAELSRRGSAAVQALNQVVGAGQSAAQRQAGVWALSRHNTSKAQAGIRSAFSDQDEMVRLTAVTAAGQARDRAASSQLEQILRSDTAPLRREAATALGRIGAAEQRRHCWRR